MRNRRRLTCVHEAGHSVIAAALGLRVNRVHVASQYGGGGVCECLARFDDPRVLSYFLAGVAAECRMAKTPVTSAIVTASAGDAALLIEALQVRHPGTYIFRDRLLEYSEVSDGLRKAELLITRHWSAVTRIALLLEKHNVLSGAVVRRFVKSCGDGVYRKGWSLSSSTAPAITV